MTDRIKCNYCQYTCLSLSMLDVHLAKYHEHKLAAEADKEAETTETQQDRHPEWPKPHPGGIGFKDCPACHRVGMVTLKVSRDDHRWGKAQYCPRCYPRVGAVPVGARK